MPAPPHTTYTKEVTKMMNEVDLMIAGFTKAQKREFATFSPEVKAAWKLLPLKARLQWADGVEQILGGGVPASHRKPKPADAPKLAPDAPLDAMAECLMVWKPLDAADGWDPEKLHNAYVSAKNLVKDWYSLRPGVIGHTAAAAVLPLRGSRIEAWVKQVFEIIDPHLAPNKRGAAQLVWAYDSRTEEPHPYTPQQQPVTMTALDDMPAPAPETDKPRVPVPVFLEHLRRDPAYTDITAEDIPNLPRLVAMRVMASIPETADGTVEALKNMAIKEPDMADAIEAILKSL